MFVPIQESKADIRPGFNFFSRVWYFYLTDLFQTGKKRPIEENDIWGSPEHCKVKNVSLQLERAWETESRKNNPSFGWALFVANKGWLLHNFISQLILATLRIVSPILMSYLLDWLAEKTSTPKLISTTADGYIWALLYSFSLYLYVSMLGPRHEVVMQDRILNSVKRFFADFVYFQN